MGTENSNVDDPVALHRSRVATQLEGQSWIPRVLGSIDPGVRLVCLPYAGGAASAYREWAEHLLPHVQLCPVELPGRGTRFREPLVGDLDVLVAQLADAVGPLFEQPCAVYGHSMGGLLAYELCRLLDARGRPLPRHLFVAAMAPPHLPRRSAPLHALPDAQFAEALRRFGGTPEEVFREPGVMKVMAPIVRNDLRLVEGHRHREGPPLDVPLWVVAGDADRAASADRLQAWDQLVVDPVPVLRVRGPHLFVRSAARPVAAILNRVLRRFTPRQHLAPPAAAQNNDVAAAGAPITTRPIVS